MLSIPRDLWVQIPTMDTDGKINTAHFLGDAYNYPGGGPALAHGNREARIWAFPSITTLRFNFDSFEKVSMRSAAWRFAWRKTIDDPLYPGFDNYGYDPLHIDAGCQHMDWRAGLEVCAHAP